MDELLRGARVRHLPLVSLVHLPLHLRPSLLGELACLGQEWELEFGLGLGFGCGLGFGLKGFWLGFGRVRLGCVRVAEGLRGGGWVG